MLKNHVLITSFIILFCTQLTFSAPITMTIELHGKDGNCAKYTKRGMDYLEIKYARVLQFAGGVKDKVQRIAGNVVCKPVKIVGSKYHFKCDGSKGTENMKYVIMIAISAKKQMLSGQINYRYNDTSMGLVKNKFLDVNRLDSQKFEPDQHISIKSIEINGLKTLQLFQNFGDCQDLYPRRLIADHGMYMSHNTGSGYSWVRTYFDPVQMGEAIGYS